MGSWRSRLLVAVLCLATFGLGAPPTKPAIRTIRKLQQQVVVKYRLVRHNFINPGKGKDVFLVLPKLPRGPYRLPKFTIPSADTFLDRRPVFTSTTLLNRRRAMHNLHKTADLLQVQTQSAFMADNLSVVSKTELDTNSGTPVDSAVASGGSNVLATGNIFASTSQNGGASFQPFDVASIFDGNLNGDQICAYVPTKDVFVWVMLYSTDPETNENSIRVAYAPSSQVPIAWNTFDLTSKGFGRRREQMDFPDVTVGATCIYITVAFQGTDGPTPPAVLRIPIQDLTRPLSGPTDINSQNWDLWSSSDSSESAIDEVRVCQNIGSVALFGGRISDSQINVYKWAEGSQTVERHTVQLDTCNEPDTTQANWMDRVNHRITGAALLHEDAWFAWSSGPRGSDRPFTYATVVYINTLTWSSGIVPEDIYLTSLPVALPLLAASDYHNSVAVSVSVGDTSVSNTPNHFIGFVSDPRELRIVFPTLADVFTPHWGDYSTVKRDGKSNAFSAEAAYGTSFLNANNVFLQFKRPWP